MTYKLTWMPDVLLKAGLRVAESPGWRERGRAEMGTVIGVMCHHTGTAIDGNMPTLRVLEQGRAGKSPLKGPLSNLGLGRDGTFYVVAAGRANHAGLGQWHGITAGNSSFIGIEAEHGGDPAVPWPAEQMDAYARGVAALLRHIGAPVDRCIGHKEWAPGRKVDPTFDMEPFRRRVAEILDGKSPALLVPAQDDNQRPTLMRGSRGDFVQELQEAISVRADGDFGPKTEAALRAWQRVQGLRPDGVCGPKTWARIRNPAAIVARPSAPAAGNGAMTLGQAGLDLIHSFEGCARKTSDGRFKAYPDPGSHNGKPWTIGWGTTGRDIVEGLVMTQAECDQRFVRDIQGYVDDVNRAVAGVPTTQNQFDALVSFHYNTGKIAQATLTRRHCAGQHDQVRDGLMMWVKNDGVVMRGLMRRREAEADLYERS